jgi:hypothetical protein
VVSDGLLNASIPAPEFAQLHPIACLPTSYAAIKMPERFRKKRGPRGSNPAWGRHILHFRQTINQSGLDDSIHLNEIRPRALVVEHRRTNQRRSSKRATLRSERSVAPPFDCPLGQSIAQFVDVRLPAWRASLTSMRAISSSRSRMLGATFRELERL